MHAKLLQSCLTLCDPVNCGPPGSSVCGIFQARILEWVAISYSRGSSPPRDGTHVSYVSCIGRRVLYHWCRLGSQVIVDPPYMWFFLPCPRFLCIWGFAFVNSASSRSCSAVAFTVEKNSCVSGSVLFKPMLFKG